MTPLDEPVVVGRAKELTYIVRNVGKLIEVIRPNEECVCPSDVATYQPVPNCAHDINEVLERSTLIIAKIPLMRGIVLDPPFDRRRKLSVIFNDIDRWAKACLQQGFGDINVVTVEIDADHVQFANFHQIQGVRDDLRAVFLGYPLLCEPQILAFARQRYPEFLAPDP